MNKIFYTISLLSIYVFISCKNTSIDNWSYTSITTPVENVEYDIEMDSLVAPYSRGLEKEMSETIGYSSENMMIKEMRESSLGNFVSDAVYQFGFSYLLKSEGEVSGHYVFSFLNVGGLRTSIMKGQITVGDIFSLMPFDNEIVVLKLKGENILKLGEYNVNYGGHPASNIEFDIKKTEDNYTLNSMVIGNSFFDQSKEYYVITTDYLAGGGDKMTFFSEPLIYLKTGKLLRDLLIDTVKSSDDIYTPKDGRWNEN